MRRLASSRAALAVLALTAVCARAAAGQTVATDAAGQLTPGSTLLFSGTADATDIGLGGVMLDITGPVTAATSGNTGAFLSFNTTSGDAASGHLDDIRVGNGLAYDRNLLVLGGYRFTLLGLPSGPYGQGDCYVAPAPGQLCSPYQSVQGEPTVNDGISPFYVANAAVLTPDSTLSSTAAFDLFGTVTGPGGVTSSFTGTIASSFPGLPYQYVLYTLEQEGLSGLPFSGTFVVGGPVAFDASASVVPEPATVALVGVGLAGLGVVRRRRRAAGGVLGR